MKYICILIIFIIGLTLIEAGDTYPPWDFKEVSEIIAKQLAEDGQVTFRKQFRVPRENHITIQFQLDHQMMVDLRASGTEPVRFSDLVIDDELQGIFIFI